jgi:hypothetical protein
VISICKLFEMNRLQFSNFLVARMLPPRLSDSPFHFPNDLLRSFREKGLSPRRVPRRSLLTLRLSEPRVRLESLLLSVWLRQIRVEPTGGLQRKSSVYGLNGLRPNAARRCPPFKSSTACRAFAPAASFRCFQPKNMAHHISQLESEIQNIPA